MVAAEARQVEVRRPEQQAWEGASCSDRASIAQIRRNGGAAPHAFPNATKLHLDLCKETPKVPPFCGAWDWRSLAVSDCNHPIVARTVRRPTTHCSALSYQEWTRPWRSQSP